MPRVTCPNETDYVSRRLQPIIDRLHADRSIREDFLRFAGERGGDLSMMVQRLHTAWWRSRTPQFVHFFVLTLTEFGLQHGLIQLSEPTKASSRPRKKPANPGLRPRRAQTRSASVAPRRPSH